MPDLESSILDCGLLGESDLKRQWIGKGRVVRFGSRGPKMVRNLTRVLNKSTRHFSAIGEPVHSWHLFNV